MPGICPRCSKNVYFAEEKQAVGKSWHKLCFVCAKCKKLLDSGSITEHDGDMFCNSCYRKNFGPKGYGFGGGAGTLSMDDGKGYSTNMNKVDHQAEAYIAPRRVMTEANGNSVNKTSDAKPFKKPVPKWGGAEICPRCNRSVFIAELMRGAGKAWHKSCFTCNICNKRVDSSNLCERDGDIFCKACYGKNFGPKGFGFGLSAGSQKIETAATAT
ncbi:cysteine and glycine-rich protein 1 [Lepeophtheirus salmonis]|uniref:Cysteine and glycine-rich protein 1 n=1 Tax=Lepeophtheirus salmonis TaxID=72036 RepID=D3PID6_LEPSM|nr:cysteine and glycine-rich protein 1-like [Lepeophtheirus salmonis]ADD38322.1 Cysteine and glycine-rich protein 1 [Lepeophtheirus salmonis]